MRRSVIIALLLLVLLILMFSSRVRVPGQTTQKEQARVQGMSLASDVSL